MDHNLLNGIPLLGGLSPDERADLARLMTVRQSAANEPLFWIGDTGSEFLLIQRGRVAITCPDQSGKDVHLATLGPGDFLGEISLLDGGPRTATARAVLDATLLCLDRAAFHEFVRRYPSAAIHIMTVLGRRQRDTVDKLRGIRNLEDVMQERMTPWQHAANAVAAMAGGHKFLITHAALFVGWITLNLLLRQRAFDPFPFPFLSFWASVEAIFLSMIIVISQNMQTQKDRVRTELDYQVALKVQWEIMQLHQKMDELPGAILQTVRAETSNGEDAPQKNLNAA